jgi:cytochrome P450 family 6
LTQMVKKINLGMRFGLMQTKVGLTTLLRNFKFTVNEKTKEPLKMNPASLVLSAQGEIWLDAHKIS